MLICPVLTCSLLICPLFICPLLTFPLLWYSLLTCPLFTCSVFHCLPVLSQRCPLLNCSLLTCPLLTCPLLKSSLLTVTLSSVRFKFVCNCPVRTLFYPFIMLLVVSLSAVDLSTVNLSSVSLSSVNLSTIKVTVAPELTLWRILCEFTFRPLYLSTHVLTYGHGLVDTITNERSLALLIRKVLSRYLKTQALIPDCTTVDSPFVRHQPRSVDSPVRIYQREKLCMQQRQPRPLLCEKVTIATFWVLRQPDLFTRYND